MGGWINSVKTGTAETNKTFAEFRPNCLAFATVGDRVVVMAHQQWTCGRYYRLFVRSTVRFASFN